ncbi:MAG: glycine zipper domain-containing protein [Candidatus Omnitrophota bacterium]
MKKLTIFLSVLIAMVAISGCTTTQKGAATGAAVGAGLGAIIGHQSGETAAGAGIGAAAGAITGAIVGEKLDKKFCPVCGRRFKSSLEHCPYDGTKLELIEK